jgi:hypothetical protein
MLLLLLDSRELGVAISVELLVDLSKLHAHLVKVTYLEGKELAILIFRDGEGLEIPL